MKKISELLNLAHGLSVTIFLSFLIAFVLISISPFTGGLSFIIFCILLFFNFKVEKGYLNYLKLVQQLQSNSLVKSNFNGDRSLNNDSYKLYLTKQYGIEKNNALDKIVCDEKLFNSIDEALAYADTLEQDVIDSSKKKSINQNTITEPQPANDNRQANPIKEVNVGAEAITQKNSEKTLIIILIGVLIIGFIAYFYFKSSTPNNSSSSNLKSSQTIDPNKPYSKLREEIISSGWKIYKRPNEIKGWSNKPYPELDFCSEDYCVASFINQDGSKVREVGFGYCSTDRYIKCPGKPNGFQEVDSDIIISKNDSDNKFLKNKKRFED